MESLFIIHCFKHSLHLVKLAYHFVIKRLFCIIYCEFSVRYLALRLLRCVQEKSKPLYTLHCHNSGKQCEILTEFCNNNAMSNCKQITKFK